MFSQFRNVVEGLAQPRLPPGAPRHENTNSANERGHPPPPAKPSAERSPLKAKLEDRLRASFTIGDVSGPSTPSASSRVSPAPQYEHPLPPDIDHPLSPISIPLPLSPPPDDHDHPSDTSYSPSDPAPLHCSTPITLVSDSSTQHCPSDDPATSQPSEGEPTVSEDGIDTDDTTESISTTGLSHSPVESISDAQSAAESTDADGHEPGFVSVLENSAEIDHPAFVGVEALQEQLRLMEQRFTDVSASFAKLQTEKEAADKVLQELTSVPSCQDADALRDYLQNAHLKVEISQDEIKRLTGKLTRQEERIGELRETHRLESKSQIELVDELRSQIQRNEALFKATQSSKAQLEADITKRKAETNQLRAEAEKLSIFAKDEEEKRSKAVSLLKTVRQKLVKAEKDREDALKEIAALKESQKVEHDKEQLDRERLQGELNKLKIEKEVSLADHRAQFEKDLAALKQRGEKELSALRSQFELETIAAKA
ncbi:hypothetical protein EI94DRAFT_1797142 [Lactarius quietus]|nr:hypothetical protein EI94DRAFT_1797142 [Lactarius quietus]